MPFMATIIKRANYMGHIKFMKLINTKITVNMVKRITIIIYLLQE